MVERYNEQQRVIRAAKRYAAWDKSDPFALTRALSHIAHGLCKFTEDGKDGWYDAEEHSTADGGVYYTNMVRP